MAFNSGTGKKPVAVSELSIRTVVRTNLFAEVELKEKIN